MFKTKPAPLFKDLNELKEFIKWCKSEHLNHVQLDGVTFAFSDSRILTERAIADADNAMIINDKPDQNQSDSKTDEELLFWSAQNS